MSRVAVALSSLDKVLWPLTGFTKGQMLEYYTAVAPTLLPHLVNQPLTLGRFPGGVAGRGFAQIECRGCPEWMATAQIRLRNGQLRNFCLAHDLESLLWIANQGTIELHTFLGQAPALEQPTAILFDLDPEPPAETGDARRAALILRDWLSARNLSAVVKTTGGIGLHVLVPLNSPHTYSQTRRFARLAASQLESQHDWIVDSAANRDQRAGTVLIDWAQNNERRTMVVPYSLRASDAPSVSTPVAWEEVERDHAPLSFAPGDVIDRITRLGDLFAPARSLVQSIAGDWTG
jgi:bifunctional non-homologous end joining protein LigD